MTLLYYLSSKYLFCVFITLYVVIWVMIRLI
nr:MAG TPA: hypothetical protein [Caudoviricetes sp.]